MKWIYHRTQKPRLIDEDAPTPGGWAHTPDVFVCQDMDKDGIAAFAQVRGVELDKRKSKENMIRDLFRSLG